jgi:hypothetical protein
MTGDTLHWITLILQVITLVGVGALFTRRYPRP